MSVFWYLEMWTHSISWMRDEWCFKLCAHCTTEYFKGHVGTISSHVFGDQNGYYKLKYEVFLTLIKWFSCPKLITALWRKRNISLSMKKRKVLTETYSTTIYSGVWVENCCLSARMFKNQLGLYVLTVSMWVSSGGPASSHWPETAVLDSVACTDFLKGRSEKKGTLARVLAPKRAL